MATFAEIKEVRLYIQDPWGFTDLLEVASLPSTPAHQTAYKLTTDGVYYATEKETGASASDYDKLDLLVSDATLTVWIDDKGVQYAKCQALRSMKRSVGRSIGIKKNTAGTETTEYYDLRDRLDYINSMLADCKEEARTENNNNTGRHYQSTQPTIAGGNL